MGKQIGCRLYSCISKNPQIVEFSLTGGIFTATFTCALSRFLILNLTSSKYSNLSLLRTEKTYSSRSLNSALLHLAITLSMKGFDPLSSMISSLRPMETSTSSIDPGKRVDLPNIMLARLISTKYFVSFSSVESCSTSTLASDSEVGTGCSERVRSLMSLSIVGCCVSGEAAGQRNNYQQEDQRRVAQKLGLAQVISRSFTGQIKNSQILSNYHRLYQNTQKTDLHTINSLLLNSKFPCNYLFRVLQITLLFFDDFCKFSRQHSDLCLTHFFSSNLYKRFILLIHYFKHIQSFQFNSQIPDKLLPMLILASLPQLQKLQFLENHRYLHKDIIDINIFQSS